MSDNTLPSPTAAVFILIVLGGFLLFILSIPEVDRQEILRDRNSVSEEINLLSLNNIKIDGYEGYKRETINYDSFNLNNDYQKVYYQKSNNIILNSNLFNSESFEFSYNPILNNEYLFSSLEFNIMSLSSYGKLKVYLNNNLISEISPLDGQKIKVDFDIKNQINGNNIVKIVPSYQGLNPFNKFKIELSEINYVENFIGSSDTYKSSFFIESDAIISEATLYYLTRSPDYNTKYSIYLNNNFIYSSNNNKEVSLILPSAYILEGLNIIEYQLNSNSDIDFILPILQLKSERSFKSDYYLFDIDDRLARLIINNRVDCKLYSSSNIDYEVSLNNFNLQIKDYNSYQKDICNNLVYGENKLQIISNNDIDLDYLEIVLV